MNRKQIFFAFLFAFPLFVMFASALSGAVKKNQQVLILQLDGAIGPASVEFIQSGIKQAQENSAQLLILQLDTPGGLEASMRDINKAIMASPLPIVTYVAPSGARAASAGTYMLYASHIAAMAPGTNLGAATPVQMGGIPGGGSPDEHKSPNQKHESEDKPNNQDDAESASQYSKKPPDGKTAMERKMENDAAAYIRSLAELRGRNIEWAEQAVRQASSLSAEEALQQNVIDMVAKDIDDLLRQLNGKTITIENGQVTLSTQDIQFQYYEPNWRIKLLAVLTDPNIAYFLMLLGFYGLIYEFMNPGFVLPGVIGAICLVLALYAFQVLPINYAGVGLILLGIIFMAAEAFVPSFGVLGLGGIVAFSVGSVILLDEEGYSISIPMIVGNAIVCAGLFIWVLGALLKVRRSPVVSGVEDMLNSVGIALTSFDQSGPVQVNGERWNAVASAPLEKNQPVRVKAVNGLVLEVEPIEKSS